MTTAALVIGGGRASRLGGADKASIEIDGITLVDAVYRALPPVSQVVAVGPDSLRRPGIAVVREDPPFAGPVAALLVGLAALAPDVDEVWVLACDLPRAGELVAALGGGPIPARADGVLAVDGEGRRQWLAGRYRTAALRRAAAPLGDGVDAAMRALLGSLVLEEVAVGEAALDLDTWEAIAEYRSSAAGGRGTDERKAIPMSADTPAELDRWVAELAIELGVVDGEIPTAALLDVTRDVAHAITRPAGPLTTYLIGRAVAGGMPFSEAAERVHALIASWTDDADDEVAPR